MNDLSDVIDVKDVTVGQTAAASKAAMYGVLAVFAILGTVLYLRTRR